MFGRIRISPSPPEWLEMESPSSKLFKDDSLSIYEATLLKLKQGSQRSLSSKHNLSPSSQDPVDFESSGDFSEELPQFYCSCSKQGLPDNSSSSSKSSSPDQEHNSKGREVPIHILFSRYNKSHIRQDFPCSNNKVVVENLSSTM